MKIQLSAGQGPAECQRAVGLMARELEREYHARVLTAAEGMHPGCFSSIVLELDEDVPDIEGTILWIAQSPYRPHHKRKNWFIHASLLTEAEPLDESPDYRIEYFHVGGKGGQNVNKVETGVRLIHLPTGLTATAAEERTQQANRRIAMRKLQEALKSWKAKAGQKRKKEAWHEHYQIVRGNPVRIYEGEGFRRKE